MPGDKVVIEKVHREIASTIYRILRKEDSLLSGKKIVLSVYGGSGVGKSETASLLAYFLNQEGHKTYIISGDNYPKRVPENNDIERLGVFRNAALKALSRNPDYSNDWMEELRKRWEKMEDLPGNSSKDTIPYWLTEYRKAGTKALNEYLASETEIDFDFINSLISDFKRGADSLVMKRMGRHDKDIFLEKMGMADTQILLLEWTHGNNPLLQGVDYPVYLYSSPEETLEHRKKRARDSNTETSLISLVLKLEHQKLISQAKNAWLIVNKQNRVMTQAEIQDMEN